VIHGASQSATPSLGNPLSSVNQGGHFEKIHGSDSYSSL
jgi:hypothetical protein